MNSLLVNDPIEPWAIEHSQLDHKLHVLPRQHFFHSRQGVLQSDDVLHQVLQGIRMVLDEIEGFTHLSSSAPVSSHHLQLAVMDLIEYGNGNRQGVRQPTEEAECASGFQSWQGVIDDPCKGSRVDPGVKTGFSDFTVAIDVQVASEFSASTQFRSIRFSQGHLDAHRSGSQSHHQPHGASTANEESLSEGEAGLLQGIQGACQGFGKGGQMGGDTQGNRNQACFGHRDPLSQTPVPMEAQDLHPGTEIFIALKAEVTAPASAAGPDNATRAAKDLLTANLMAQNAGQGKVPLPSHGHLCVGPTDGAVGYG